MVLTYRRTRLLEQKFKISPTKITYKSWQKDSVVVCIVLLLCYALFRIADLGIGLSFGTAGLRAPMGAGFSRMNSLTVIQTSQGLAEHLLKTVENCEYMGVVIGYDARHHSKKFANLAATVFKTKGIKAWLYEEPVHTPMVPWGMQRTGEGRVAAAGVMITASHNPAQDNGYKVYGIRSTWEPWERAACQIRPPQDSQIAASILQNLEPVAWELPEGQHPLPVKSDVKRVYHNRMMKTLKQLRRYRTKKPGDKKLPPFVYTPLHGVGLRPMTDALRRFIDVNCEGDTDSEDNRLELGDEDHDDDWTSMFIKSPPRDQFGFPLSDSESATSSNNAEEMELEGHQPALDEVPQDINELMTVVESQAQEDPELSFQLHQPAPEVVPQDINELMTVVESQAQPDPDFPTVRYPNPEEKGALDAAIATADSKGIRLILANDPDADRFAAAEKVGNEWHQFTGDQVGVLLAFYIYQNRSTDSETKTYFLTSIVSSSMLPYISHRVRLAIASNDKRGTHSFQVGECLTGFKWLGEAAERAGSECCFGYEEALGYMLPWIIYDKDGISAALLFLQMCAQWGSPWLMLQSLYEEYGYFETMNTYWRSPDQATTTRVFDNIRSLGKPYPKYVGEREVLRWRDLTIGYESAWDGIPSLPITPDTQCITCWLGKSILDKGIRFTIRASGTEPKIKGERQPPKLTFAFDMLTS